jgi:hypothetical protein
VSGMIEIRGAAMVSCRVERLSCCVGLMWGFNQFRHMYIPSTRTFLAATTLPQTATRSHHRQPSSMSTPPTPSTEYFPAQQETPTRPSAVFSQGEASGSETHFTVLQPPAPEATEFELHVRDPPSAGSSRSFGSSALDVLDDEDDDLEMGDEDDDDEEEEEVDEEDSVQPLVSRGRRRKRKRWEDSNDKQEKSLIEVGHRQPRLS